MRCCCSEIPMHRPTIILGEGVALCFWTNCESLPHSSFITNVYDMAKHRRRGSESSEISVNFNRKSDQSSKDQSFFSPPSSSFFQIVILSLWTKFKRASSSPHTPTVSPWITEIHHCPISKATVSSLSPLIQYRGCWTPLRFILSESHKTSSSLDPSLKVMLWHSLGYFKHKARFVKCVKWLRSH